MRESFKDTLYPSSLLFEAHGGAINLTNTLYVGFYYYLYIYIVIHLYSGDYCVSFLMKHEGILVLIGRLKHNGSVK